MREAMNIENMIVHGNIAFPEPDVATIGGITPWLKVADAARAAQLPVTTHGVQLDWQALSSHHAI